MEAIEMQEEGVTVTMEMLLDAIEQIDDAHSLSQIMKTAVTRQEKLLRGKGKRTVKTEGIPSQLKPNNQWVDFVLKHSKENGWESFQMKQKGEMVEMADSSQREDGAFVFSNTGKDFTRAHAMGLSKWLKDSKGELWTSYEAEQPEVKGKKTEEEKEAKKAEEKAKKEEEKAKKAEEAKAKKEAEKAEKEAKKAEEKAKKEAEKEAAKRALKVPAKAIIVKRAISVSPAKGVETVSKAVAAAGGKKTVVGKPMEPVEFLAKKKEDWTVSEGKAKLWVWKGKEYIRNWKNEVYEADGKEDDGYGPWVGIYVPSEDRMNEVEEPEEEDE